MAQRSTMSLTVEELMILAPKTIANMLTILEKKFALCTIGSNMGMYSKSIFNSFATASDSQRQQILALLGRDSKDADPALTPTDPSQTAFAAKDAHVAKEVGVVDGKDPQPGQASRAAAQPSAPANALQMAGDCAPSASKRESRSK
jgi:hypothetical protein